MEPAHTLTVARYLNQMIQNGRDMEYIRGYLKTEGYSSPDKYLEAAGKQYGFNDAMINGVALGLKSEIAATLDASKDVATGKRKPTEFFDALDQHYDLRAASQKMYEKESPGEAMGAELAGAGAVSMVPLLGPSALRRAGLRTATTAASTLQRTAKIAATEGFITGVGEGEGTYGRLLSGLVAMTLSTGMSLGIPAFIFGFKYGGKKVKDVVAPGGKDKADELIASAVSADRPTSTDPFSEAADELKALQDTGKPVTIMETGENLLKLGEDVAQAPGAGSKKMRDFVESRHEGQYDRIVEDLDNVFGRGPNKDRVNVFELEQTILDRKSALSKPLYDEAYKQPVPQALKDDLTAMLQKYPDMGTLGYTQAKLLARSNGVSIPKTLDMNDWVSLDYLKRGLNELSGITARGGSRGRSRGATIQAGEVRDLLVSHNSKYGEALDTFSGHSLLKEALDEGKKVGNKPPQKIQMELAGMSAGEKDLYRIGAAEKLYQIVEDAGFGRDLTKYLAKNRRWQDRIKLIFPDDAEYRKFMDNLKVEKEMSKTKTRAVSGSPTHGRQQTAAMVEGDPGVAQQALRAALSPQQGALDQVMRSIRSRSQGRSSVTREQLANQLTVTDPKMAQDYLKYTLPEARARLQASDTAAGERLRRQASQISAFSPFPGLLAGDQGM